MREQPDYYSVQLGMEEEIPGERDEPSFNVLLLGDFGGNGVAGEAGFGASVLFDRGDLDAAVRRVAPRVTLSPADGTSFTLGFRAMEDFHPDGLYQNAPPLQALREYRRQLQDPGQVSRSRDLMLDPTSSAPKISASDLT